MPNIQRHTVNLRNMFPPDLTDVPALGGSYIVGNKLGSGTFGEIRFGYNKHTHRFVAIKMEAQNRCSTGQLLTEFKCYNELGNKEGIPKVYAFGTNNRSNFNYLVMDLLGPSLEDLLRLCNGRFSLKTCALVAIQVIDRLEYVHKHKIIHRDVKPDNFAIGMLGSPTENIIHVIDFGLAKERGVVGNGGKLPKVKRKKRVAGTARYMSVHSHLGFEQTERDDMESVGHMLVYLAKGSLPWQGIKVIPGKDKCRQIGRKKFRVSIEILCESLPSEFSSYMAHVRRLKYSEIPNYYYLRNLFDELSKRLGHIKGQRPVFDWSEQDLKFSYSMGLLRNAASSERVKAQNDTPTSISSLLTDEESVLSSMVSSPTKADENEEGDIRDPLDIVDTMEQDMSTENSGCLQ